VKAKSEKALSPLVGLDLVALARSAEFQWFTFGQHQNAEVTEAVLAPFALHVSCPWRLLGDGNVLAGSNDHRRPAEENTSEEDSDWPLTGSEWRSSSSEWRLMRADWIDVREQQLREQLERTRHSVSAIEVDDSGWFRLVLSSELVLEVFPDASRVEHDEVEFWRLFQPGLDASHFVVTSNGADRV
jgi:hypothetical protein